MRNSKIITLFIVGIVIIELGIFLYFSARPFLTNRDKAVEEMLGGLPYSVLDRGDVKYAGLSYEIEGRIKKRNKTNQGLLLDTTIPIAELPPVLITNQTKIYKRAEKAENIATFSALLQGQKVRIGFSYNIKKKIWHVSKIIIY